MIQQVFKRFIAPLKPLKELSVLQCYQQREGFEAEYQELVKKVVVAENFPAGFDKGFDVILLNNFIAKGKIIEHFGTLEYVYSILADDSFLIRHVFPDPRLYQPYVNADKPVKMAIDAARKKFYNYSKTYKIPQHKMAERYHAIANRAGFEVQDRNWTQLGRSAIYYFTEHLIRIQKPKPKKKATIRQRIKEDEEKVLDANLDKEKR